jgi:hypothetical protein
LLLPIIFCIQTVYFDSFINLSFTRVTSRAGTAYPFRAPEFDTVFWWVRLTQSLIFCVVRPCFWWVRLAQSLIFCVVRHCFWWVRLAQSLIFCVVRPCFWWVCLAQSLIFCVVRPFLVGSSCSVFNILCSSTVFGGFVLLSL